MRCRIRVWNSSSSYISFLARPELSRAQNRESSKDLNLRMLGMNIAVLPEAFSRCRYHRQLGQVGAAAFPIRNNSCVCLPDMAGSSNTLDTSILVESKARRPLQDGETTHGLCLTVPSCDVGGSLGSPGLWRHVKAIVRFGLKLGWLGSVVGTLGANHVSFVPESGWPLPPSGCLNSSFLYRTFIQYR